MGFLNFSLQQLGFLFGFLLLFLVVLLLGESYLGILVMGAMGLFFLINSRQLDWSVLQRWPLVNFCWVVFGVSVLISTLTSVNLPLSLDQVTFLSLGGVVFYFFLLLPQKFMSRSQVVLGLLFLGLVLVLISLVFMFQPELGRMLPGKNLIFASYGHNHLAAYLLLIIPSSWWLALRFRGQKLTQVIGLLVPLALTLGLLVSFGRVAVLIGFLQLVVIAKIYWAKTPTKKISFKLWKRYTIQPKQFFLTALLFLFILVLGAKVFLSTAQLYIDDFKCPLPQYEKRLCKPIDAEARPRYWQQALRLWRANFWLGSGPGTYGITIVKYRQDLYSNTSYAHNAFLQHLAEMGLVGGVSFGLLMLYLFYLAARHCWLSRDFNLDTALTLGLIAIFIDVLFDFDWSFLGIWSTTLIFLALILKRSSPKKIYRHHIAFTWPIKFGWLGLTFGLVIAASIYLLTEILISQGQVTTAFQLFPYFSSHRKLFEESTQLTDQDRTRLLTIYKNYPDMYHLYLLDARSLAEKIQLKEKLVELDPLQRVYKDLLQDYLDSEHWSQAATEVRHMFDLVDYSHQYNLYLFDYYEEVALVEKALLIADALFNQGQVEEAGGLYKLAQQKDEWILDRHEPIVYQSEIGPDEQFEFFQAMGQEALARVGQQQDKYLGQLFQILKQQIEHGQHDEVQETGQMLLSVADWIHWDLFQDASQLYQFQVKKALQSGDISLAQDYVVGWYDFWQMMDEKYHSELDYESLLNLAKYLVKIGTESVGRQMYVVAEDYRKSYQVIDWVLWDEQLWMKVPGWQETDIEEIKQYVQATHDLSGREIGWTEPQQAEMLRLLLDDAVRQAQEAEFNQYLDWYQQLNFRDYQVEMDLAGVWQGVADERLKEGKVNEAELAIKAMQRLQPDDYWLRAQLGHYYMYLGLHSGDENGQWLAQAQAEYEHCLEISNKDHYDCSYGWLAIEDGQPYDRYSQVSQIIRGEKEWTDFVE